MSIKVTQLPDAQPRDRHVAIGTFDGVHLGHQAVIDDADTVLTFEPHPLTVIHPEVAPKLLMTFEVKRDVIDGLGVEDLVVIPFDRDFSKRSAEQFVEEVLVERLGAKKVSVGENFRFGAKARGDVEMLQADGRFEVRRGVSELAAVNVGIRPTFETGRGLLIESYLLDFEGDLYGQNLRVAFVERLRGEKRFESVEALVEAMKADVEETRRICDSYRPDGDG
jgi:FAD synthase